MKELLKKWSKLEPSPREKLDIIGQPLNPTTVERRGVNDLDGCPIMSSNLVTLCQVVALDILSVEKDYQIYFDGFWYKVSGSTEKRQALRKISSELRGKRPEWF